MSKLMNGYKAEILAVNITAGENANEYKKDLGKRGILSIWKSEKLHPGQKYIRFRTDDNTSEIQTSCGKLDIVKDRLTITTQNGANTYVFKLLEHVQTIDFRMKLPERYWHICDGCGKRELLSSKEAFEQGWDYPGPDGIYKENQNYGFGVIAPRTCGDCSIVDSFYWKLLYGEDRIDITEQPYEEMLERIMKEPWSLLMLEEGH